MANEGMLQPTGPGSVHTLSAATTGQRSGPRGGHTSGAVPSLDRLRHGLLKLGTLGSQVLGTGSEGKHRLWQVPWPCPMSRDSTRRRSDQDPLKHGEVKTSFAWSYASTSWEDIMR